MTISDDDVPLSKIREQLKASKIPNFKISVNPDVSDGIMTSDNVQANLAQLNISQPFINAQTGIYTTHAKVEFEAYPAVTGNNTPDSAPVFSTNAQS